MTAEIPIQYFPALRDITLCRHAFIERIPGMTPERAEQLMAFLTALTTEDGTEDAAPGG